MRRKKLVVPEEILNEFNKAKYECLREKLSKYCKDSACSEHDKILALESVMKELIDKDKALIRDNMFDDLLNGVDYSSLDYKICPNEQPIGDN